MRRKTIDLSLRLGRAETVMVLTSLILCLHPFDLGSESLTLTTYYPSPYGVYSELRSTRNAYFAYNAGSVGVGTLAPANKLSVLGNADFSGNLGIGTASPSAKLDIAGSVKIADGTQGTGKVLTSDTNGLASWQSGGGISSLSTYACSAGGCGGSPGPVISLGTHKYCALRHSQSVGWQYGMCNVWPSSFVPGSSWNLQCWCSSCDAICFD